MEIDLIRKEGKGFKWLNCWQVLEDFRLLKKWNLLRVCAIYLVDKSERILSVSVACKKTVFAFFRGIICDEDFEEGLYLEHKSEV